jgi:alcohol dehydrogenase (cytochrome c)
LGGPPWPISARITIFALSIDTGEIRWQYSANLEATITSVCCGWNNKGVAISEDKVFIGQLDGKLVALDRATGTVAWAIQAERWQDNFSITSAPVYVNGLVITGFAGADRGTRGRVKAYDAKDGRLVWTFFTIPGPGEPGHDTWPKDNDAWMYGGASAEGCSSSAATMGASRRSIRLRANSSGNSRRGRACTRPSARSSTRASST